MIFCLPLQDYILSPDSNRTFLNIYFQNYVLYFLLVYGLPLLSSLLRSLFFSPSFLAENMNTNRDEHGPCCYFHPKEVVVGVCPLCLRERLLTLAAKQGQHPLAKDSSRSFRVLRRRPKISLPKVFALGSLLHRLESRRQMPDDDSDKGSIASLEESFISIKFGDNGQASWEGGMRKISDRASNDTSGGDISSVIEHAQPRGAMRWHKRIGQLLQLARWKRSSKAAASHVGTGGNVERRGWMRSLTRRTTD